MDQPKDKKPLAEAVERFWSEAFGKVEATVEETVKRSLLRVRAPSRDEVAKLSARLDAVARRLEALSK
jgi:hypothetical protein